MPSVEKLLLEIKADIKDLKNLRAELKTIKKESAEAGDSIGNKLRSGANNAAKGFAALFAASKVLDIFKSAIADANKLDQALLKVESSARAFGQSTIKAKDAAIALTKDGFLNLKQSASAVSNLMASGLNVEQSKKFLDAAKNITAFGNTIGDAAQATEDLTLGLLRGSAEVIDNASPALKSLSLQYSRIAESKGKAAAAQFAYNEIVKKGAQFQGDAAKYLNTTAAAQARFAADTEKLSATLGRILQPILVKIIDLVTPLIQKITEATQAVGRFLDLFNNSPGENLIEEKLKLEELAKSAELTAIQKQKLNQINKQVAKEYGQYLKALGAENASLEEQAAIIKEVDRLKRLSSEELKNENQRANNTLVTGAPSVGNGDIGSKIAGVILPGGESYATTLRTAAVSNAGQTKSLSDIIAEERNNEKATKPKSSGSAGSNTKVKIDPYGFLEYKQQVIELEAKYKAFIKTLANTPEGARLAQEAFRRLKLDQETVINKARQSFAEYTENRAEAFSSAERQTLNEQIINIENIKNLEFKQADDLLAAKKRFNREFFKDKEIIANRDYLAELQSIKDKEKAEKDSAKRVADAKRSAEKRANEEKLRELSESFSAASQFAGGFGSSVAAMRKGDAFGVIGGIGQSAGAINPAAGVIISSVASIGSTIAGIFGESEEAAREREETAQRQREEQIKIANLQAGYLASQLEIARAAGETPFKNLQKELRLIDINAQIAELAGGDKDAIKNESLQQKLSKIRGTLSTESGTIAQGALFSGVEGNAASLTKFLKEREEQAASVQALQQYLQSAKGISGLSTGKFVRDADGNLIPEVNFSLMEQIAQNVRSFNVDEKIKSVALGELKDVFMQFIDASNAVGTRRFSQNRYSAETSRLNEILSGASSGNFSALLNELQIDTTKGENLLSLLQSENQIQLEILGSSKKIAENTASLKLGDIRKVSGIDTFSKSIFDRGRAIFSQPSYADLKLPSSVENAQYVTSIQQNFNAKQIERLGTLIALSEKQVQLQGIMAKALEKMANSNGASLVSLIDQLSNISSLQIK
jgi:hypothetical protein